MRYPRVHKGKQKNKANKDKARLDIEIPRSNNNTIDLVIIVLSYWFI